MQKPTRLSITSRPAGDADDCLVDTDKALPLRRFSDRNFS